MKDYTSDINKMNQEKETEFIIKLIKQLVMFESLIKSYIKEVDNE